MTVWNKTNVPVWFRKVSIARQRNMAPNIHRGSPSVLWLIKGSCFSVCIPRGTSDISNEFFSSKNPPANVGFKTQEMYVRSLDWEDSLE